MKLNSGQLQAIDLMVKFLNQKQESIFLLKGSAGTGKTTCVQTVYQHMGSSYAMAFSAPTNKATKVLKEMSEREGLTVECRTIYSLLGLRVVKESQYVRVEALADSDIHNFQAVVIDEGSMMNKALMKFVFEAAASTNTKFIFMLDPMQLPPVGEDESEACSIPNMFELTKVERHDNQILTFATYLRDCILKGERPKFRSDNDENGGVYTVDFRRMRGLITKAYTSETYRDNPNSCKTIAWRNDTVGDHNDMIRRAIYGDLADQERFQVGERVVACHPIPMLGEDNEFAMVTDEEGTIENLEVLQHPMWEEFKVYHLQVETEFSSTWADCFAIHPDSERAYNNKLNELASEANKKNLPWSSFWALKNEFMHDIRPCHAITAHRSQGSTYRTTFVDAEDILSNNYSPTEALKCLYVACTRPSDILVIKTR